MYPYVSRWFQGQSRRYLECPRIPNVITLIARFMGKTWGPSGADRPRWALCWPLEPCYLGSLLKWWNIWISHILSLRPFTTLWCAYNSSMSNEIVLPWTTLNKKSKLRWHRNADNIIQWNIIIRDNIQTTWSWKTVLLTCSCFLTTNMVYSQWQCGLVCNELQMSIWTSWIALFAWLNMNRGVQLCFHYRLLRYMTASRRKQIEYSV